MMLFENNVEQRSSWVYRIGWQMKLYTIPNQDLTADLSFRNRVCSVCLAYDWWDSGEIFRFYMLILS